MHGGNERAFMKSSRSSVSALTLLLCFTLASPLLAGCSQEVPQSNDAETSEEALTRSTPLDRVTVTEIAAVYERTILSELDACVAAHPDIQTISSEEETSKFVANGNVYLHDLGDYIELQLKSQSSITVSALRFGVKAFAEKELKSLGAGTVAFDKLYEQRASQDLWFRYSSAYELAAEEKALSLVRSPAGVDVPALRQMWKGVQEDRDRLDSAFLRPVAFAGHPTIGDLRKAFKISVAYQEWGSDALDAFQHGREAAGDNATFAKIRTVLENPSIKKRFYFEGQEDSWSHHVLVLVDEYDQAYGFSMGYSE